MAELRTGNSISQIRASSQEAGNGKTSIASKLKNISLTMFCVIFGIGVVFSALFYALFSLGIQNYHKADPIKVYQFFEIPQYSQINSIVDSTQYLNLYGAEQSGILNYIEHEANLRAVQGKPVVKKQLKQQNLLSKVHKNVKKAANTYLQMMMSPLGRGYHTWIILIKNKQQVPVHEVDSIKKKYPNDLIILVSHQKLSIQSFTTAQFPTLKIQSLRQFLKTDLSINQKDIKAIIKKKSTIPQAFQEYKRWDQNKKRQQQQAERINQQKLKIQEEQRIKKQKQEQQAKLKQQQEKQNKSNNKKQKKGKKEKKSKTEQKEQSQQKQTQAQEVDVVQQSKPSKKQKKSKAQAKSKQKQEQVKVQQDQNVKENEQNKKQKKKSKERSQTVIQIKVEKKENKKGKKEKVKAEVVKPLQQKSTTQQNEVENKQEKIESEDVPKNQDNSQIIEQKVQQANVQNSTVPNEQQKEQNAQVPQAQVAINQKKQNKKTNKKQTKNKKK